MVREERRERYGLGTDVTHVQTTPVSNLRRGLGRGWVDVLHWRPETCVTKEGEGGVDPLSKSGVKGLSG